GNTCEKLLVSLCGLFHYLDCSRCVYASSITKEQRAAIGAASVAGTDREGFDEVKGNHFNMVIFAQEAWRSRYAFRSDTRYAQEAFSWDREAASDIATGSPMTPILATHWRMPCQRVLEIAPNAARESQSSCRRRSGQFPRTDKT